MGGLSGTHVPPLSPPPGGGAPSVSEVKNFKQEQTNRGGSMGGLSGTHVPPLRPPPGGGPPSVSEAKNLKKIK